MITKKPILIVLLISLTAAAFLAARFFNASDDRFVEYPLPLRETHRLFDIGIVDANGDDRLDIYTSNHHFRQVLLIADGKGGYRDVLSEWGLDQSREFPMAELSFSAPRLEKAGVYIYWLGTQLVIQAHRTGEVGRWSGSLHTFDPVEIVKNEGFHVDGHENKGAVTETTVEFSPQTDGKLVLRPGGQGLPEEFRLTGAIKPGQVFVGRGKVSPPETSFSLTMQDRHALAWADYNGDGTMDVFIDRGALSGTLRANPDHVQRGIKDELLLGQENAGRFVDVTVEAGIEKKGCSGRHARWLDFNGDGLLDLFVNCYDREHVQGDFPKQLYRQNRQKRLQDVAMEVGLGLPDQQMAGFAWTDVDSDGDVDLVAFQDEGFFLYRNREGKYFREEVLRRSRGGEAPRIGQAEDSTWFYDGKFTMADFDADGDVDLFSASRSGNVFLKNDGGELSAIELSSVGLPPRSMTANWVDYDNDGLPDLHLVPQGLFRQRRDHGFEATGLLAFPEGQYQAAVVNWFDLDNDGRLDVLMALRANPSFKHWWQFSAPRRRAGEWQLKAWRNVGRENHWLQVKLVGEPGNRQGIGARLTVVTPAGRQVREVGSTDGAFFSQGHYRLYFGLGQYEKAESVRVRWSDGYEQELGNVLGDKLLAVERKSH